MNISTSDTPTYTSRSSSPTSNPTPSPAPTIRYHDIKTNPIIPGAERVEEVLDKRQAQRSSTKDMALSTEEIKDAIKEFMKFTLAMAIFIAECWFFMKLYDMLVKSDFDHTMLRIYAIGNLGKMILGF